MNYDKFIPLIVAPCSQGRIGGINTWVKNLKAYSDTHSQKKHYNILAYTNQLRGESSTKNLKSIFTGLIIYSKLSWQIILFLRKYKPSLIHITSSASFGLIKDLLLIRISELFNTPVVMHWRFGRIPQLAAKLNWEWRLLKRVVQKCSFNIVIDELSFKTLLAFGVKNVVKIPNPIGINLEQESKEIRNKNYHQLKGHLIFIGRLVENKGIFELINACTHLEVVKGLLLVGPYEDNIRRELNRIACKRENGSWLIFTGSLTSAKVQENLKKSSILLLPSYSEGFPNVIVEAMTMGCAVIATDVGAIPEMLGINTGNPCGICVPVKSVEKLKTAIEELCDDVPKTKMMGKNGFERVLKLYTMESIIEQYNSVWYNVINKKQP